MTNIVHKTIKLVQWIESGLVGSGWFVLESDGSAHTGEKEGDLKLPGTPSFFSKVYRMKLDGDWVNTWVRFTYNHRDNWADFFVYGRDPKKGGLTDESSAVLHVARMLEGRNADKLAKEVKVNGNA